MSNKFFLTTKEVARLCRVSDATVKRWEDANLLNSERTNGGHRRFRSEEVARFQRENNLGLKICHGDESVQTIIMRRRPKKNYASYAYFEEGSSTLLFFQALLAGCEEASANILICEFLKGKTLGEIFDNIIAQTMKVIGELWTRGELTVAQEHLATRSTLTALHKLRSVIPVSTTTHKLAMCCAIESDFHEIPAQMAQIIFEANGYEALNFGANMPLYSFAEEILHHSPEVVCISATIISDIERLSRDYKEFQTRIAKLKTTVLFGGRAFEDSCLRQRYNVNHYVRNFSELAEYISK